MKAPYQGIKPRQFCLLILLLVLPAFSLLSAPRSALAGGIATAWGYNDSGAIGNGTAGGPLDNGASTPVLVSATGVLAGKSVSQTSSGFNHACAVTSDGSAYCWGSDSYGQLGDGSQAAGSLVPVAVSTSGDLTGKKVTQISAGFRHTCAATSDGGAYCWGNNDSGELGNGGNTASNVPVAVSTSGALAGKKVAQVSAGYDYSCAITTDGYAFCWGDNVAGGLGNGTNINSNVPVAVSATGGLAGKAIVQISAGRPPATSENHTCAITSEGRAYCWGVNLFGELGDGTTTNSSTPVAVSISGALAGRNVIQISAGGIQTCALTSDGSSYCWGASGYGEVGAGSYTNYSVPVAVSTSGVLAGKTVSRIAAGCFYTCAVTSDGYAACWGINNRGQLGDGSNIVQTNEPVAVIMTGLPQGVEFTDISAGFGPTSAVAGTPSIGFGEFKANLKIGFGFAPKQDRFYLESLFTLGTNSNGIDPTKESVTIKIGTFTATIPAGSFKLYKNLRLYSYAGKVGDVQLAAAFISLGSNRYSFEAMASGANLNGITNPVSVTLTVGDDSGTTSVIANNMFARQ